MTLPYPLLARGKYDTDMSKEEKERYEQQVRENSIQMLMKQAAMGMSVEDLISRADKISDFILNGQRPASPTPEPKGPFTGGIGSDNRTYPFTNEHGKHFRIEYDGVFNSIIIAYEDGVNVRHTLDELPHAGK